MLSGGTRKLSAVVTDAQHMFGMWGAAADGIWGQKTERGYQKAGLTVTGAVKLLFMQAGYDLNEVRLQMWKRPENFLLLLDHARKAKSANGEPWNPEQVAALMSSVWAESRFDPREERMYSDAFQAKKIFRTKLAGYSHQEVADLIALGKKAFFDVVYEGINGNYRPDDGSKFLGRGFIQLTGRGNYAEIGKLAGYPQLVDTPELANDPVVAANLAVAFWQQNCVNKVGRMRTLNQMVRAPNLQMPGSWAAERTRVAELMLPMLEDIG